MLKYNSAARVPQQTSQGEIKEIKAEGTSTTIKGGEDDQNRGNHQKSGQGGRGPRPTCQVYYEKIGHTAIKCYRRHDNSYQTEEVHSAPMVAMTTSNQVDPNWYTDSSATDHITSDLDRLAMREKYHDAG